MNKAVEERRPNIKIKNLDPEEEITAAGVGNDDDLSTSLRYGEYGVIDANQEDESHYDKRRESLIYPYESSQFCTSSSASSAIDDDDDDHNECHSDDEEFQGTGRIRFSNTKLYGRQAELKKCHELFKTQHHHKKPGIIFVSGYSGCGKTTLVDEFVKQITTNPPTTSTGNYAEGEQQQEENILPKNLNPLYLTVKYEKMQATTPFSAIRSIFDNLKLDEDTIQNDFPNLQSTLEESLGDDVVCLQNIFPSLKRFLLRNKNTINNVSNRSLVVTDDEDTLGNYESANGDDEDCALSIASNISLSGGLGESSMHSTKSQPKSISTGNNSSSKRQHQQKRRRKAINKSRLMFLIRFFFRGLCTNVHRPLILLLDDLQWADPQSLELIHSLVTDTQIQYLFIFVAYRSNEVPVDNQEHPISKLIDDIEQEESHQQREEAPCNQGQSQKNGNSESGHNVPAAATVRMERIELKDLRIQDVGDFIADTLRFESSDEVQDLTEAIFAKTLGNPFFVRQVMEHLIRKNVLYYDTISFQWSWNLQQQLGDDDDGDLISEDLVEMVKSKISHLESSDLKHALIVASYTRATFDVDTLLVLLHPELSSPSLPIDEDPHDETSFHDDGDNEKYNYEKERKILIDRLEQAVSEGLLIYRHRHQSTSNSKGTETRDGGPLFVREHYSFAHDRIQEAARSLLPEDKKYSLLAQIGNALEYRASFSCQGEDWMYFVAARHLNRVFKNPHDRERCDDEQRFRLAALNLRTAELSLELFAFPAAVVFCKVGIQNLPEDEDERWSNRYYELTIKLFSLGAEAEYGSGNSAQAEYYCNQILTRRRKMEHNQPMPIHDAVPAYKVLIEVTYGKAEAQKAYELNLEVLEELGIKFPKGKRMQQMNAWLYLKQIKSRYVLTEESIRKMPVVTDELTIDTMTFLQKGGSRAMASQNTCMYVLMSCESVRWMYQHGLTDGSASILASLANVLMHVYGDFETSPKLAELAITCADRQNNKYSETQAINTASHNVLGWVQPIRPQLKYHIRAHESGMVSGNIDGAMMSKIHGYYNQIVSGAKLQILEADLRTWIPKMRRMGHAFLANLASIFWQATLNLIGSPENGYTTILTGEAMDEKDEIYQDKFPCNMMCRHWKAYLLVVFGNFESGAELALERGDEFHEQAIGFMYGLETFFRAISLVAIVRQKKQHPNFNKYKKVGMILFKRLKKWVKNGCVNLAGPTRLLQAETAAMLGKTKTAKVAFEDAAGICRRAEFHNLVGLTRERYAVFLTEVGDASGARTQISHAIESYERWGAKRKVEILKQQLSN